MREENRKILSLLLLFLTLGPSNKDRPTLVPILPILIPPI